MGYDGKTLYGGGHGLSIVHEVRRACHWLVVDCILCMLYVYVAAWLDAIGMRFLLIERKGRRMGLAGLEVNIDNICIQKLPIWCAGV